MPYSDDIKLGFTLIELMIVVIIVGILAAVGISMMTANTLKAKATEAQNIVRAINAASKLYAVEYDKKAENVDTLIDSGYMTGDHLSGTYFSKEDFNETSVIIETNGVASFHLEKDIDGDSEPEIIDFDGENWLIK